MSMPFPDSENWHKRMELVNWLSTAEPELEDMKQRRDFHQRNVDKFTEEIGYVEHISQVARDKLAALDS